MPIVFSIVCRY